jgi:uncharacterized protein YndB with AHSA1/START domain
MPFSQLEVFDALTDAEHYPDWLIGARKVRIRSARWPRKGASFDHEVGGGPVKVHDRTTVTECVQPELLALRVRARPVFEADVVFRVRATCDGCEVEMTEHEVGVFRSLTPLTRPLVRLRNDRSLAKFEAMLRRRRPLD